MAAAADNLQKRSAMDDVFAVVYGSPVAVQFYRIAFDEAAGEDVIEEIPGDFTQPTAGYVPYSMDWSGDGKYLAVLSQSGSNQEVNIYHFDGTEVSDCSVSNIGTEQKYHITGNKQGSDFLIGLSLVTSTDVPAWWPDGTQSGCGQTKTTSAGEPFNYWSPLWAEYGHKVLFENDGDFSGYSPETKVIWITYEDEDTGDILSLPPGGSDGYARPVFNGDGFFFPAIQQPGQALVSSVRGATIKPNNTFCYENSISGYQPVETQTVALSRRILCNTKFFSDTYTFSGFGAGNDVSNNASNPSFTPNVSISAEGRFILAPRRTGPTTYDVVILELDGIHYGIFGQLPTSSFEGSTSIYENGFSPSEERVIIPFGSGWKIFRLDDGSPDMEFDATDWVDSEILGSGVYGAKFRPVL